MSTARSSAPPAGDDPLGVVAAGRRTGPGGRGLVETQVPKLAAPGEETGLRWALRLTASRNTCCTGHTGPPATTAWTCSPASTATADRRSRRLPRPARLGPAAAGAVRPGAGGARAGGTRPRGRRTPPRSTPGPGAEIAVMGASAAVEILHRKRLAAVPTGHTARGICQPV